MPRYVAQQTGSGWWWVLKRISKNGARVARFRVVESHLAEDAARALAEEKNRV